MVQSAKTFNDFLKKAIHTEEIKKIPNSDRFFSTDFFDDEVVGNMDVVLFVIDFRTSEFIYLSPNTLHVHGYSWDEIMKYGPTDFYQLLHPRDNQIILSEIFKDISIFLHTHKKLDYTNFKISYNYRLKQKDNSYKFLTNKFTPIIVGEGNAPLVIVGTVRDISEIYTKKELFCRIQEANNLSNKLFEKYYSINDSFETLGITKREFDVIKLVHEGKSSKEIADELNNSLETIHTHRKNIIKKLNVKNMIDVIILAKDNNWI